MQIGLIGRRVDSVGALTKISSQEMKLPDS